MLALVASRSAPGLAALGEVEEPIPAAGEALVEVRAISLNRGEVRRLASQEEGFVPGWDLAGVVAQQATDGSGPPAGARVVGLVSSGAWAERVAVPTETLAELPQAVSFAAAAALPVAGLTAYRTLGKGGLALGSRVLITGASGGVGRFAVQLANRAGARVSAVVGSRERGEGLTGLGAEDILVGLESEGPSFDLVLESVGGASLAAALARVAPGGTIVSFGNSSGEPTSFDVSGFYGRASGARLYAFLIFSELASHGAGARDLRTLAESVANGTLDPQVALEASWREPAAAIEALLDRRVAGKAVLLLD
jgi:NADPH:quinone reductase